MYGAAAWPPQHPVAGAPPAYHAPLQPQGFAKPAAAPHGVEPHPSIPQQQHHQKPPEPPQRGVMMVSTQRAGIPNAVAAAQQHSLKLVQSSTLDADLLITLKGRPSIAFVLGSNTAALHNQTAAEELASRIERVALGFKHAFVLLPISFTAQPRIMEATVRLASLPSICTIHTAPGQELVAVACELALQHAESMGTKQLVQEVWEQQALSWEAGAGPLSTLPIDPGVLQAVMPVLGSLHHLSQATTQDIRHITGCSPEQAQACAGFWQQKHATG